MNMDFNKPATTDLYTAFVSNLQANEQSLGAMLDPNFVGTVSNAPSGTKRFNSTSTVFEQWSGSAWSALATGYALKAGDTFSGPMTFNNNVALQWKDSGGTAHRVSLLSSAGNLYFGDVDNGISGGASIYNANANHQFMVNGSSVATITSTLFNSGIVVGAPTFRGTSTQTSFLAAITGSANYNGFQAADQSGNRKLEMLFLGSTQGGAYGAAAGSAVINAAGTSGLTLSTADTARLFLDGSGNVGVGTSNPSAFGKLAVIGNITSMDTSTSTVGGFNQTLTTGLQITSYKSTGSPIVFSNSTSSGSVVENGRFDINPSTFLVGTSTQTSAYAGRGLIEINGASTALLALDVGGVRKGFVYHDGSNLTLNADSGSVLLAIGGTTCVGISTSGNATFSYAAATAPYAIGNSGTAFTLNCIRSNVFTLTMTGNVAAAGWTISNPQDGQTVNLFITQDSTGSRTLAYPSSFKWPNGVAGVLSTAANAVDLLCITYRAATGFWYATLSKAFA